MSNDLFSQITFSVGEPVLVRARSFTMEHDDNSPTLVWFGALVRMSPTYLELHSARRILRYADPGGHEVLANVASQALANDSYISRKVQRVVVSSWMEIVECTMEVADKLNQMAVDKWGTE